MKTPIVTIVGRPNVGKSTLFNRIAGSRIAITTEIAGTTRDRIFHKVSNNEIDYFLVDTGGLEFGKGENSIEDDMQLQAQIAIDEADLILFILDGTAELMGQDYKAAELLRKKAGNKPIILIANKCDNPLNESELAQLYALGLGDPNQISALHKNGIDILKNKVIKGLKEKHFITKDNPEYQKQLDWEHNHISIALVGKPNVGKSSLINALLKKEKLIVSEIPGTTRDTTDSIVKAGGKDYNFIDTAGLKKRGSIERGIEKFSALRSMAAIERSDIALLVIDTSEEIGHQDQQIANYILKSSKGLIIVANKWDIKDDEDEEDEKEMKRRGRYLGKLKYKFPFLSWASVIFTSAVTKKNLHHIFDQVEDIVAERKKRIPTAELNNFLERATMEHKPSGHKTTPRAYYMTQVSTNPPHFLIFVNKKKSFHFSYIRYIENKLRDKFGFNGTAIRLEYKEKTENPFVDKNGKPKRGTPKKSSSKKKYKCNC